MVYTRASLLAHKLRRSSSSYAAKVCFRSSLLVASNLLLLPPLITITITTTTTILFLSVFFFLRPSCALYRRPLYRNSFLIHARMYRRPVSIRFLPENRNDAWNRTKATNGDNVTAVGMPLKRTTGYVPKVREIAPIKRRKNNLKNKPSICNLGLFSLF